MVSALIALIGVCGTLNARLIEKNTGKPIIETKSPQFPSRIRLTRDAFDEDTLTGFSREDNGQSLELVPPYNKRVKDFYKPIPPQTQLRQMARKPRESTEKVEIIKNHSTAISPHMPKVTLIKKPIPKYNEMDCDDEFEMNARASPAKVADSSEHEDEDFNVDDYDFDVTHDEYVGRGKPLEPRVKHEDLTEYKNQVHAQPVLKLVTVPEIKIQSKVIVPTVNVVSIKKERAVELNKKRHEKSKEIDYYDDTTTTKRTDKDKKDTSDIDDENNGDGEDGQAPARMARSPWKDSYNAKLEEKTSVTAHKHLAILPMFPTAQDSKQLEHLRATTDPNDD